MKLKSAKAAYKQASMNGNRQEEARWANVIADILKGHGEYVEALRWLRIDYEVSTKYLPEKHLLPTCQSIGELYLRLHQFKEALSYQKKHLQLAKNNDDLIEQQRACTQLGRTYYDMFSLSENDVHSKRSAKKYFKLALELVCTLRSNPSLQKSGFFLKEFIDAQNNLGMLEMDLDNFDEAEKILLRGLQICDDEEVDEDDDARSRLHNNLGSLYIELRAWEKAKEHIERDIIICKNISHRQGEAKGYINLGELHCRVQKYDDAKLCYKKALDIARSLEDEDALVDQISQNIETVKESSKVLEDIKLEEQRLKKLTRKTVMAKGKPNERRCLLDQCASLDQLIEKSSMINMWPKNRECAKRKKRVATELCDKEKLSDSFLATGESYQKLRNFSKARKWYMKSWNMFRSIGNLEGQALAKINIGAVLDSAGDWAGALQAFEEGYRLAVEGKLPSVQISALENMHYSHMIRFDNLEEARKLQEEIKKLKSSLPEEGEARNKVTECCSETESEGGHLSDGASKSCDSPLISTRLNSDTFFDNSEDNIPLCTLVHTGKRFSKNKLIQLDSHGKNIHESCDKASSRDIDNPQLMGRKRIRVVLSDDEFDHGDETSFSLEKLQKSSVDDMATSSKGNDPISPCDSCKSRLKNSIARFYAVCPSVATQLRRESGMHIHFLKSFGSGHWIQKIRVTGEILLWPSFNRKRDAENRDLSSACAPINLDESTCSYKSESPKSTAVNNKLFMPGSLRELPAASHAGASESKTDGLHAYNILAQKHLVSCKIGDDRIYADICSCVIDDMLDIEALKIQLACSYYLQLHDEGRSKGLLPIIQKLKCDEKVLGTFEPVNKLKEHVSRKEFVEAVVEGWVHIRLIKLYIDHCTKLSEPPNVKLVKKLYNLEVSEDEVVISDCELQDMSISPFLDALLEHETISILDISHNLLGNGTIEKLQRIFASSSQKYGGLTLDLHCNRYGPAALFQICKCSILFNRLEVLNLSENRLTDACGLYLSTILQNCRALHSLKVENCSITSRTIQRVADSLDPGSVLSELCLGRNNPISGTAIINLLTKLGTLKRFSELSLDAVKLSKPVVDTLCLLAKTSNLSGLMLGGTNVGPEGLAHLVEALSDGSQELVKLDLSRCRLSFQSVTKICENDALVTNLLDLNLGGNLFGQEGHKALTSLLRNPLSSLKVLVLDKCSLGSNGILQIIHALADNNVLEELNLAENINVSQGGNLQYRSIPEKEPKVCHVHSSKEAQTCQQAECMLNSDCLSQEIADSEDDPSERRPNASDLNDSASSGLRSVLAGCQFLEELSTAIWRATHLQLIDLSRNGFSVEAAESFYSAWFTSKGHDSVGKHIQENIIHFSTGKKKCCGVRVCCRRS